MLSLQLIVVKNTDCLYGFGMKYHDTHAHLEMLLGRQGFLPDNVRKEGIENLSLDAKNWLFNSLSNHRFVVQSTIDTANFQQCQKLFANFQKVWLLLGSHPEQVGQGFDLMGYLKKQKELVMSWAGVLPTKLVGIGEVGLDYYHCKQKWEQQVQKELFRSQIELALELDLPLVIHCRDGKMGQEGDGSIQAFEDLFVILDQYPDIFNRFLVHCFTGSVKDLENVVKRGGLVAFGGVITFGASADGVREAVKECPLENFVLETDLPFLSPNRGQVCLPTDIGQIAKKLAQIKGLEEEKVWELSLGNSGRLFRRVG
jgi:TatD DNase family protein